MIDDATNPWVDHSYVLIDNFVIPISLFLHPLSFLHLPQNCSLKVLEGRSYRLHHPWVGVVNRSQADINKNIDMITARRREREFFASSVDYRHLADKMGSEYLAKLLSKVELRCIYMLTRSLIHYSLYSYRHHK